MHSLISSGSAVVHILSNKEEDSVSRKVVSTLLGFLEATSDYKLAHLLRRVS